MANDNPCEAVQPEAGAEPFSPEDCRRLSPPAMRTFTAIADLWRLTLEQRRRMLGSPSGASYYRWVRQARTHRSFALNAGVLLRISVIYGIHQALSILFAAEPEGTDWLHGPHATPPFGGQAPLGLMLNGSLDGLLQVHRFLAGAQQGLYMPPCSIDRDFQPYGDDEIMIHETRTDRGPGREDDVITAPL